jgi:hypothetical protein
MTIFKQTPQDKLIKLVKIDKKIDKIKQKDKRDIRHN